MTNKIKKFLYTLEHLIPDAHEEIPTFAFYHPLLKWYYIPGQRPYCADDSTPACADGSEPPRGPPGGRPGRGPPPCDKEELVCSWVNTVLLHSTSPPAGVLRRLHPWHHPPARVPHRPAQARLPGRLGHQMWWLNTIIIIICNNPSNDDTKYKLTSSSDTRYNSIRFNNVNRDT